MAAIDGVVFEPEGADTHEDKRRILLAPFNDDFADFTRPGQVKVLQIHQDCVLGGHWHEYREMYGVIGEVAFALKDFVTEERRDYLLVTGSRLLIPGRVAHVALAKAGSILLGATEEPYTPGRSDHKYNLDFSSAVELLTGGFNPPN